MKTTASSESRTLCFSRFVITAFYIAIRLLTFSQPRTLQEFPPRQNRFPEAQIPDHVTYAYQEGATIVPNDEFYTLPEDKVGKEKVDILFLIANAPVETASMPETGSQKYTGLATDMKLAMDALLKKFPTFFHV